MASELDTPGLSPGIRRLCPSIRRRIYELVGIAPYPGETGLVDLTRDTWSTRRGFYGLLLSCRAIYQEASKVLYSSNRFVIRYSDYGSLRHIRNLRSSSIKALSHLKIVLVETSCHHPLDSMLGPCCTPPETIYSTYPRQTICNNRHDHDSPLDSDADLLLAEWDMTATHLAKSIIPDNLALAIVCDVCPTEAGRRIAKLAAAVLLHFPALQSCSLRLCQTPHPKLQQIAEETVLQACQKWPLPGSCSPRPGILTQASSSPPVSLLSLPRELRFRILEYTDLVTPWAEVIWSRQHKKGFAASLTYCEDQAGEGYDCPPFRHHGCQFRGCLNTLEPSAGCFCRAAHSAYAWPLPCQCWAQPQALFLVCRTLSQDAQTIFFSKNRFVIHDFYADPPYRFEPPAADSEEAGYPFSRFAASIFLTDIVPAHCLSYLRSLELVFPPYMSQNWPQEGDVALRDWMNTLDWAKNMLNVPRLLIRLVTTDVNGYERWPREFVLKEEGDEILAGYRRIVSTLSRLGKLDRFYAQLVWPWRWSERTRGHGRPVEEEERLLKEEAERLIMGPRYESLALRAAEPPPSIWEHEYWAKWS